MSLIFDSSSSTSAEMSTGLPSMISMRQPFLRTSVRTKSSSSPYCLNTGARSSISVPSGSDRIASRIWLARAAGRRLAGARAVRLADGGEEQVQVAGDVGHGADGGARVVGDGLLLDGDDRREAVDEVDVGLGHLRDEALGVARQRFHVAPLALGVDGVEGQARFARAGEAGDHDQLVARNLERDVLQVVDARALHRDGGARPASALAALELIRRFSQIERTPVPAPATLLLLVSWTGVETLPISPWSARYSQAVVTPSS